jgi:hypothetical protein
MIKITKELIEHKRYKRLKSTKGIRKYLTKGQRLAEVSWSIMMSMV